MQPQMTVEQISDEVSDAQAVQVGGTYSERKNLFTADVQGFSRPTVRDLWTLSRSQVRLCL
jgi:hypothetical protein